MDRNRICQRKSRKNKKKKVICLAYNGILALSEKPARLREKEAIRRKETREKVVLCTLVSRLHKGQSPAINFPNLGFVQSFSLKNVDKYRVIFVPGHFMPLGSTAVG